MSGGQITIKNVITIIFKFRPHQTTDVLDHHRPWHDLSHESQNLGEQIPFIIMPQLFSSYRKRWAGHPTSQQIGTLVRISRELAQIRVNHVPFWTIHP